MKISLTDAKKGAMLGFYHVICRPRPLAAVAALAMHIQIMPRIMQQPWLR